MFFYKKSFLITREEGKSLLMVVNLYNFTNKQTPMVKNIKKCIYRILLDYLTDLYYKV